ncbi:MAG: hypothetical protein WBG50_16665 [Desulfomonilaceae bacterium]
MVRITGSGVCHTNSLSPGQYVPVPFPGVFGQVGAGMVEKFDRQLMGVVRDALGAVVRSGGRGVVEACLKGIQKEM